MLNFIVGIGEWVTGLLLNLLTVPAHLLGMLTGLRGGMRYFKIKSM
jgi:hypothetical protein